MDLEENIRIAAEQFIKDCHVFGLVNALEGGVIDLDKLLIDFSKSQAAKDYWYNEFKLGGGILKQIDNVGIIGHVNHGKPMVIVLNDSWDAARQALNKIESIVPISDIIPEPIISKEELFKQEFLLMHDKAMERSIAKETYKESRAWDIKKEKKVSHKRNNKRRK